MPEYIKKSAILSIADFYIRNILREPQRIAEPLTATDMNSFRMNTTPVKKLAKLARNSTNLFAGIGLVILLCADKAAADGPWSASSGFSSTQGPVWFYQQRPQGATSPVTNMTFASAAWRTTDGQTGWEGNYPTGVATGHPGQTVDIIRKWVAPSDGTVSITGRVYKIDTGGGAGVKASVEKNGTALWTKTVAYNDGIGYTTDADLGNVTVNSGDSIAFIVDNNGVYANDYFGWDPTITKVASYDPVAAFSGTQGPVWYYQQRPQGATSPLNNMSWTGVQWNTTDNTGWEGVYPAGVAAGHPGQTLDVIRKWVAPASGTISVTGSVYKLDTGGGAGIIANVEHNGVSIWSRTVAYNDATGYSMDSSLGAITVSANDTMAFIVDNNGTYSNDWYGWGPVINLVSSGAAPTWTLNTSDTLLTLSIIDNCPAIVRLEDAATHWNWTPSPIVLPLVNKVYISGTENVPNWSYSTAAVDTSGGGTKVTLTFGSTAPSLTLTEVWQAYSGGGPVEERSTITNNTGGSVTYNDVDLIASDLTVTADNAVTLWRFNRSSVNPVLLGATDPGFATGTLETLLGSSTTVASTVSDDLTPAGYVLPFEMLDVGGAHGLYIGYENVFGLFNTTTYGNADVVRNTFYMWGSNSFSQATGAGGAIALPGMFYGTYKGDTDSGSNKMKNWFWTNKMTPTLRNNTNEPLVESNVTADTEAEANSFFATNPSPTWGLELIKEDYLWTDDATNGSHGSFGWDWTPNTVNWPNGMKLGTICHNNGMKLSLYMANTYLNVDISTSAGISSEEVAVEARYNGTATNFVGPGYDYWRSDMALEVPENYLSHLGFMQVLDYMISNHSNFRWENCSGGGSKKSFDLLQRQTNQATEDSGATGAAEESYRKAYYGNSYMINPMQLEDQNVTQSSYNGSDTDNWAKYTERGGFLGGWMYGTAGNTWQDLAEYQKHVGLYRSRQRPILRGADVYHILPICDNTNWDGFEFLNTTLNKGSVILYKPNAGVGNSPVIKLKGLIATGTYSLTFQDRSGLTSSYTSVSGSTLMTTGIGALSGTTGDYDSEIIWINY